MTALSDTDRAIVNRLQDGLSVTARPFEQVAVELGIGEDVLMMRLQTLLDDGVLSRFGPMYHAERLGGAFCLAALAVPEERFEEVTRAVNAFDEVAHNYRREHELNMWFVLASDDPRRIGAVIEEIEQETGLKVYDFPKLDEYYVRLRLEV
ncbi:MAG: Lrp/AsnC family transcriptional regulator [Gammaproteobacteria bacterium]|nr:Lrp/AsnC family transcriptional regulator [Gammaproteobacteria bacterium]